MNNDLASADFAVGYLLRKAHQRAATAFAEALEPLGIAGRHFPVLHALADNEPMSQRELIDFVGSDKASMVRIVDDLEAAGLATRGPHPEDRRIRVVAITAKGRKTLAEANAIAGDVATRLLAHLKPAERTKLTKLLAEFASGPNVKGSTKDE